MKDLIGKDGRRGFEFEVQGRSGEGVDCYGGGASLPIGDALEKRSR